MSSDPDPEALEDVSQYPEVILSDPRGREGKHPHVMVAKSLGVLYYPLVVLPDLDEHFYHYLNDVKTASGYLVRSDELPEIKLFVSDLPQSLGLLWSTDPMSIQVRRMVLAYWWASGSNFIYQVEMADCALAAEVFCLAAISMETSPTPIPLADPGLVGSVACFLRLMVSTESIIALAANRTENYRLRDDIVKRCVEKVRKV